MKCRKRFIIDKFEARTHEIHTEKEVIYKECIIKKNNDFTEIDITSIFLKTFK